jgi:hypothetical protein
MNFDQPALGLARDKPPHCLAVIQENIHPVALGYVTDILEGHIKMQRVASFPFFQHTGEVRQLGFRCDGFLYLAVSGAGKNFSWFRFGTGAAHANQA